MNLNAYVSRGCSLDNYASTKYVFSPRGRGRGLFVVFPKRCAAPRTVTRLLRQLGESLPAIRSAVFIRPGYR